MGDKNEKYMEYVQEGELKFLPHRELADWKIWEQAAGELTRSPGHRLTLQGKDCQFSEEASLCQEWEGVSTWGSQIEKKMGPSIWKLKSFQPGKL